jgi:hypothetical protein
VSVRGHALVPIVVVCAGVLLSGCGGKGSSSTSNTVTRSSASGAGGTLRSGQSGGSGAITIPSLGSLTYNCDRVTQRVSATLGGTIIATESVYIEADHHRHLRAGTVGVSGSSRISVVDVRTSSLSLHVIQSTEPRTLDGTIVLDFQPSPQGATATGCARTRWTSTVTVIRHDRQWSTPPGWLS